MADSFGILNPVTPRETVLGAFRRYRSMPTATCSSGLTNGSSIRKVMGTGNGSFAIIVASGPTMYPRCPVSGRDRAATGPLVTRFITGTIISCEVSHNAFSCIYTFTRKPQEAGPGPGRGRAAKRRSINSISRAPRPRSAAAVFDSP